MDLTQLFFHVLGSIWNFLNATSVREHLEHVENEHELMWTALYDIQRMSDDPKIKKYAEETLNNIKTRYVK